MHGELRMTYLLLDYLIQFKTYWKVLLVLDGWVLERPRWRSKCGVLLLLIGRRKILGLMWSFWIHHWLQMTTHNCTQICIPLLFSSRGTDGNGFLFL
ncbi:hypothetical protein ACSQ67_004128 [Phaseolus vulgaris]